MPDKAYPDEHIRGFDFPSRDFFGKVLSCRQGWRHGASGAQERQMEKARFQQTTPDAYPTVPGQYSRLQFHCKQIHSTALSLLASPPRAFTRASTGHEISLVNRKKSASSRCATSSLSISEFCSSNSSANLTLVRLKLWSSVNLMRFCQSSANLVTSLPASSVWKFHRFPNPAFSLGNTAILKHCLEFCRIPHLKSLWSTTITYPVGQR